MAPRANWKGHLQIAAVSCPVALYTAASSAEHIVFNTINRATGDRVRREFIDSETGAVVAKEAQVKGYEFDKDRFIAFEPEEIEAVMAKGDKTLVVSAFVDCGGIDQAFFDKPYYLAPADRGGDGTFALIRDGLRRRNAIAIAQAVLFRRLRAVAIRPYENGLVATTLHYDYEVRSAREILGDVAKLEVKGEMLDLARHIIKTKQGAFDPSEYEDRYAQALAELVKARIEGRALPAPKQPTRRGAADLMQALRDSAGVKTSARRGKEAGARKPGKPAPQTTAKRAPRRKAS